MLSRKVKVFEWQKVEGESYSEKVKIGVGLFVQWGCDYEEFETVPGNYTTAVVSATQTKIDTYEKKIKKSSASETKTKNAHIDRAVALNQSTDEYEKGIMRWSMLFERKAKVSSRDIVVLQQLAIGNAYLDSYVDDYKSDEPESDKPKQRKRR